MSFLNVYCTNLSSCWWRREKDEVHYWFGIITEHHKQARDCRGGRVLISWVSTVGGIKELALMWRRTCKFLPSYIFASQEVKRKLERHVLRGFSEFSLRFFSRSSAIFRLLEFHVHCCWELNIKNIYIFSCSWIKLYSFFWCCCLLHTFCLLSVTHYQYWIILSSENLGTLHLPVRADFQYCVKMPRNDLSVWICDKSPVHVANGL